MIKQREAFKQRTKQTKQNKKSHEELQLDQEFTLLEGKALNCTGETDGFGLSGSFFPLRIECFLRPPLKVFGEG